MATFRPQVKVRSPPLADIHRARFLATAETRSTDKEQR